MSYMHTDTLAHTHTSKALEYNFEKQKILHTHRPDDIQTLTEKVVLRIYIDQYFRLLISTRVLE